MALTRFSIVDRVCFVTRPCTDDSDYRCYRGSLYTTRIVSAEPRIPGEKKKSLGSRWNALANRESAIVPRLLPIWRFGAEMTGVGETMRDRDPQLAEPWKLDLYGTRRCMIAQCVCTKTYRTGKSRICERPCQDLCICSILSFQDL